MHCHRKCPKYWIASSLTQIIHCANMPNSAPFIGLYWLSKFTPQPHSILHEIDYICFLCYNASLFYLFLFAWIFDFTHSGPHWFYRSSCALASLPHGHHRTKKLGWPAYQHLLIRLKSCSASACAMQFLINTHGETRYIDLPNMPAANARIWFPVKMMIKCMILQQQ